MSDKPEFRERGAEQDAKGRSRVLTGAAHGAATWQWIKNRRADTLSSPAPEAELQGRAGGRAESAFAVGAVNSAPRITTETEDGTQRGYRDPSYKSDWNVLNSAP